VNLRPFTTPPRSGCPGVHWHGSKRAWRVRVTRDGKRVELGNYKSLERAVAARERAIVRADCADVREAVAA